MSVNKTLCQVKILLLQKIEEAPHYQIRNRQNLAMKKEIEDLYWIKLKRLYKDMPIIPCYLIHKEILRKISLI